MLSLNGVHHIAIICTNYEISKHFYTQILGFTIDQEIYRQERDSYKLDLSLNGRYIIELFSFPSPAVRASRPEATGLRHLAFSVENISEAKKHLETHGLKCEEIRIDESTGKQFFFFPDPDGLPLELYQK